MTATTTTPIMLTTASTPLIHAPVVEVGGVRTKKNRQGKATPLESQRRSFTLEQKISAVELCKDGTNSKVAIMYGIDIRTLQRWKRDYEIFKNLFQSNTQSVKKRLPRNHKYKIKSTTAGSIHRQAPTSPLPVPTPSTSPITAHNVSNNSTPTNSCDSVTKPTQNPPKVMTALEQVLAMQREMMMSS